MQPSQERAPAADNGRGEMKRVLSGIQPSGIVHLGNYLGAIKHWAQSQDTRDAFYMIADLHSLTLPYDEKRLRRATLETAAALIACGLDPGRVTLFIQSAVPEHANLWWLLTSVTSMGDLRRMTHFKDKSADERQEASAALFAYPILQAADILLYHADEVPVGEDQRQHLELSTDIARRFNSSYGPVFTIPRATTPVAGARVMDLRQPTAKMSKSALDQSGTVWLSDTDEQIRAKVLGADAGEGLEAGPAASRGAANLAAMYAAINDLDESRAAEDLTGLSPLELKEATAESIIAAIGPMRTVYFELTAESRMLEEILARGNEKARAVAGRTYADAEAAMGLGVPRTIE